MTVDPYTGYYSVLASNIAGSAISRIAHLQVYTTQKALISSPEYLTNSFRQVVSGIRGATYVVQASTNLVNWVNIETNQTTFTNLDSSISNYPARFYRVLYQP